jgi:hypothetical protein
MIPLHRYGLEHNSKMALVRLQPCDQLDERYIERVLNFQKVM